MTTEDQTPAALGEDVEDLKAIVHELAAQLQDNTERLNALRELAAAGDESAGGESDRNDESVEDGKYPAPPLILRLPAAEYDAELVQLDAWVRYVLVPTYLNEVKSSVTWCSQWWKHPQAVARLHALWIAWQELTTPEAGGWTGPSVWHRDHLDPCVAALRSPDGPFAACMTTSDAEQHTVLDVPPVVPADPGAL